MEKKIDDMIYKLLSRLSSEEYRTLSEFNFSTRLIGLIAFMDLNPKYFKDIKIIRFFNLFDKHKATSSKLDEIEKYINTYDKKRNKYTLVEYSNKIKVDTEQKEALLEKYEIIKFGYKSLKDAIKVIKELIDKKELGIDFTDISNLELFHKLNFIDLTEEEKEVIIDLYIYWQKQIEEEYYEEKNKKPQTSGIILPLINIKMSSYPDLYDSFNNEVDIKEKANYIRTLLKQKDIETVKQLLVDDLEVVYFRIFYDIENELMILDNYKNISIEEMLVIEDIRNELLIEKEQLKKVLGGIVKWKKRKC